MTLSFGYLNKIGYKGFVFPIVIGEAGSRYTDVSLSWITKVLCFCWSCTNLGTASVQQHIFSVSVPHNSSKCHLSSSYRAALGCGVSRGQL